MDVHAHLFLAIAGAGLRLPDLELLKRHKLRFELRLDALLGEMVRAGERRRYGCCRLAYHENRVEAFNELAKRTIIAILIRERREAR